MKKILFVCLGNICRSPAAEGTLIHELEKQNLANKAVVDSAGTSGYHDGEWPDSRMIEQAKLRGIKLPTQSRKLTTEDLENFDLIICMDKSNLKNVMNLSNAEKNSKKIKLFSEYKQQMNYTEVPDPYFGSTKDFDLVLDIVKDYSLGLIKQEFNE